MDLSTLPDIETAVPTVTPYLSAKRSEDNKPTDDELRDRWLTGCPLTGWGLGSWRRYSAGVWDAVHEDIIAREIMDVMEAAKGEGVRPNASKIKSVLELGRLKLAIPDERWDSNTNTVNCKNGILDPLTGILTPHNANNLITSIVPFEYDPQAIAPVWDYFLKSTVPDVIDFLQEFSGYCLTNDTQYEIALWLYGPRGSGKSTFQEGLVSMLGDKSTHLGLANIERSRFALGNLQGKTLAVASEQPAIYMTASYLINQMISGEQVTIERKFKDSYDIRPTFKFCWAMNETPRLYDAGDGLFRRVKIVRFPALAESERDPRVKKAIKGEGAGILNWAIQGLQRLYKRGGFVYPDSVKTATDAWKENNDIPAAFIAEKCITGHSQDGTLYKVMSNVLYNVYHGWCLDNGHKPMSNIHLAQELDRLGYSKKRAAAGIVWEGLGLNA